MLGQTSLAIRFPLVSFHAVLLQLSVVELELSDAILQTSLLAILNLKIGIESVLEACVEAFAEPGEPSFLLVDGF
jgi:hypothetical protein